MRRATYFPFENPCVTADRVQLTNRALVPRVPEIEQIEEVSAFACRCLIRGLVLLED